MIHYLPNLLGDQQLDYQDSQEWYQAVRTLNPKSARGIDGISASELQSLPIQAIDHLKDILLDLSVFPPWMMIAKTIPVPKVDKPRIHGYRPITVLAQCYRLWSKVITRVLLKKLSQKMPREVTGFLPGRGPGDATYCQQFLLEWAHATGTCQSGFALDLKRCFNTICRNSAGMIMQAIGIPVSVIQVWKSSLDNLTRTWTVQGLNNLPCTTNNGLPEGDPMSVTAMLAIAYAWIQHIQRHTNALAPSAFADNWGWSTTIASQHAPALRATKEMAEFLNMIIDWRKSWLWSTHKEHISTLKAAVKKEAPEEHVPEMLSAMDLGAQLTYRGNSRLGKLRDRLQKANRRLQRLEGQVEPLHSKARLITAGIYPVALYGMELVPVGSQHMDQLRTAVANALFGASVSRNSAIAIHCTPAVQDPQLVLMQRVILSARRFLLRAKAIEKERFFNMVACHNGAAHECKGPAGVLKYHLCKFGWQLCRKGILAINGFVQLPFLEIGINTLLRLCQMQWQDQIMTFTDRKALRGLPPICRLSTVQVLRKFNSAQQVKLVNEIAGAFQTRSQQAAWDDLVDPRCQHCGELDTREHRALTCQALQDLRTKHQSTFDWIEQSGSAMGDLPVVFCHEARECLFTVQWLQVEPQIEANLHFHLQSLDQRGHAITMFTDGSCFHPSLPEFRYAAFAVALDCATSDAERCHQVIQYQQTGEMPASLKTLIAGRLPGLQDIHRAEIFAIVVVMERYCNTVIYTDSATTLRLLRLVETATDISELAAAPYFDLLIRLWRVWHLGSRTFHKIKAHAEGRTDLSLLQQYMHLGNKLANDSAIHACKHCFPGVVATLEEACLNQWEQQTHLRRLFEFHLDAQKRMAQLQQEQKKEDTLEPVQTSKWDALKEYHVVDCWVAPNIVLNWTRHTAWGPTIAAHMLSWMQQFRWPKEASNDELATIGISWYELVLSFMRYSEMFFPLRRSDNHGREHLIPFKSRQQVEAYGVKFSEFANTFAIFYLQFTGLLSTDIWPCYDRKLVKSLFVQGAQIFTSGFAQRPSFPYQAWVHDVLRPFLRDHQGTAITAIPDVDWIMSEGQYKVLKEDLKGEWKNRAMAARKKLKDMRQWRKKPLQLISFGSS